MIAKTEKAHSRRGTLLRFAVTGLVLVLWFWTQSLIGARALPAAGLYDEIHQLTAPLNTYLYEHAGAADALLIFSSAIIDSMAVFLLGSWLLGGSVRPFLGLVILIGLRQLMQALCALPTPPNMIWRYPGFPSLLVTYGVGNDYFFSGHTAIAVLGATQLARYGRRWLTGLAIGVVVFEVTTVLALRAHYTMDVFAGIVAAL